MENKLTFEEVINLKWAVEILDRSENPAIKVLDQQDDGKIMNIPKGEGDEADLTEEDKKILTEEVDRNKEQELTALKERLDKGEIREAQYQEEVAKVAGLEALRILEERKQYYEDHGTLFEFPIIWDDFEPLSHNMSHSEAEKLFRMLAYSAQMFKILEAIKERLITTELYSAAQELKKKILEGPEPSLDR